MELFSKLKNILLAMVLDDRPNDKHLWVKPIEDVRFEHEVYYTHLRDPSKADLCSIFNLIPDNNHEGLGWWEKVAVKRERGFTTDEKMKVFRRTDLNDATSGICTYIPQEVLRDIHNTRGKVIGFRPHSSPYGVLLSTVVWIHYV